MERKYGWKKQEDDYRDLKIFGAGKPKTLILPDEVETESGFDPCYDQLNTSSCTGNGVGGLIQYGLRQAGMPAPVPSRLWLYGNGRYEEGDYGQDSGANIRDVINGANRFGVIPEKDWPFNEKKVTTPFPQNLYTEARNLRIHFYATMDITSIDTIRLCLFHGFPIVFGFYVYDYFESQQMSNNPVLHLPTSSESPLGGHCTVFTGYQHSNRRMRVRNSWGTGWGDKGNFWMDYNYVVQLCSDPWMNRFQKAA